MFLILLSRIVSISLSLFPLSPMTYYIYDDNTRDHTSGGRDKAEEVYSNAVQVDTDTDSFKHIATYVMHLQILANMQDILKG